MNEASAKRRIGLIEQMQTRLEQMLDRLNIDLYALMTAEADRILTAPSQLIKLLTDFEQVSYQPVIIQVGTDILDISDLNQAYFADAVGESMGGRMVTQAAYQQAVKSATINIVEQFGIRPTGKLVPNGLFDLFAQDTTVRREVQQFTYGQKAAGVGVERFKKNLKTFVVGDPDDDNAPAKGVWTRHYETAVFDTYQQADRLSQDSYAGSLNMTAFLYLGGTIAGTRPFCRERDGKCFLRSEIDKMGTSADRYGGYSNKAIGYYSGMIKGGVPVIMQAGGHACRHSWNAISDREAMRRRNDLRKNDNGKLVVMGL